MFRSTAIFVFFALLLMELLNPQKVISKDVGNSTILDVDYRELISRANLTYTNTVSRSEEGLPVGNGRMGSLVWTIPAALKFQINRVDVYANNCYTNSFPNQESDVVRDYCGGCGFVDIDFVDFGEDVFPEEQTIQHLSVYDGLVKIEGRGITARILAHHAHDVMVVEITDSREHPSVINTNLRMLRPALVKTRNHYARSKLGVQDGRIVLNQEFTEDEYYCGSSIVISILGRKAKAKLVNETEVRLAAEPGKGTFTILIASAASFDRKEDIAASALNQIAAAEAKGFDGLLETNKRWWHDFWTKSFVHLHNTDGIADYIEENYTYYLYIMASSSRGKLPPKFNGMIWNTKGDTRTWGSQHWWHNVSCLYRTLQAANQLELMNPMFDMYTNMYDACALAARQQWGSKGIFIPETIWFDGLAVLPDDIAEEMRELYLLNKPWELRSRRFSEYAETKHAFSSRWNWNHIGRWTKGRWHNPDKGAGVFGHVVHIFSTTAKIAYQYWLRYEYTLDEEWLRNRAYPMLKGTAEFYRNYPNVKKDADGTYHIYNVNNHEPVWCTQDAMVEIASMRGILPIAIRASEILNVDEEMRPVWRELLDNLTPYPINTHPNALNPRKINEPLLWTDGLKPTLRMPTRLGSKRSHHTITPCIHYDLCTLESVDPEMTKIANATFESIFANSVGSDISIWVLSKLPIAAAILGRSDYVKWLVSAQLKKETYFQNRLSPAEGRPMRPTPIPAEWEPNFPGTTIEGQGRAGEALQLALCQSVPAGPGKETVIRVFSALPKEWDAEYTLLCRGGFLVTSSMQKGQVEFVEVQSQLGGECRLRNPWGEIQVALYKDGMKCKEMSGSLLKFNTEKGENIVVVKKGTSPDRFKRSIF